MGIIVGTIATGGSTSLILDLNALVSRVANLLRRDDINTEIEQWVNFAQREICHEVDFPALRMPEVYTILVPDQWYYDLPSDFSHIDRVYYLDDTVTPSSGRNLVSLPREFYAGDRVDFEKLLNKGVPDRGTPKYFFVEHDQLYVDPAPDRAARLEVAYYRVPKDMTLGTQEPEIEAQFRHYLIWIAYFWGAAFLEKEDAAKIALWMRKHDEMLKKVKRLALRKENKSLVQALPETGMEQADKIY